MVVVQRNFLLLFSNYLRPGDNAKGRTGKDSDRAWQESSMAAWLWQFVVAVRTFLQLAFFTMRLQPGTGDGAGDSIADRRKLAVALLGDEV